MEATVSLSLTDISTASDVTGIPGRTLRKWAKTGEIAAQKVGGSWVLSEQTVEQLKTRQEDVAAA